MKPYSTMKDSGLPWLGSVPEHWEVLRLKYILRERDTRSPDGAEQLLRVSQYTGVTQRERADASEEPDTRAESLVGYKRVEPNELVVNIMLAWNGSMGVSKYAGIVSPAYCVYRFGACAEPWFFHHLLRSPVYKGRIKAVSAGVVESRLRLYTDDLYRLEALLPPLPEQAAVVRFLHHADRRISRCIRAKQQLIKLLEEQRKVIVYRAVTRGLDATVPLKPSNVEWLGDVPKHWEVRRLKSLSLVKRGASPRPIADPSYFDDAGDYAWVRIADVTASARYLERTAQRLSRRGQLLSVTLEPGALFLSIAGSVGKAIITRVKCCIHDGFVYFPQFQGNVEFLYRVFASGAPFARLGKLGTQLNLNTDTVGNISVPWPPPEEQAAIVSYLDMATSALDAAITSAERELLLLREYRIRLSSDVVTGKVDVRQAAVLLPNAFDETDPVFEIDAISDAGDRTGDDFEAGFDEASV